MKRMTTVLMAIALFGAAPAVAHDGPGELGADFLYLLKDCDDAGKNLGTPVECYETIADLEDALWGTSGIATASNPVFVQIGEGEFTGPLECDGKGHVTFKGVGRERSKIVGGTAAVWAVFGTLDFTDCDAVEFQDLAIENAATANNFPVAVIWRGSGESTWTNVDLDAGYTAWLDIAADCDTQDQPIHYFFGSRVISSGSYGYIAFCGEHWFYGSEIREKAKVQIIPSTPRFGLSLGGDADVRVFGSTIRSFGGANFTQNVDFTGVAVGVAADGGTFHMHGGIISVDATKGKDAIGINLGDSTAFAHTLDTAFALLGSDSDPTRITGTGTALSPLLWQSGTGPPVGGIVSKTGKDLYVETDCDATNCTDKDDPHLMIYHEDCSPTPWFDVVRGECRD